MGFTEFIALIFYRKFLFLTLFLLGLVYYLTSSLRFTFWVATVTFSITAFCYIQPIPDALCFLILNLSVFIPLIRYLTSSWQLTFLVITFLFYVTVWYYPALGMHLRCDILLLIFSDDYHFCDTLTLICVLDCLHWDFTECMTFITECMIIIFHAKFLFLTPLFLRLIYYRTSSLEFTLQAATLIFYNCLLLYVHPSPDTLLCVIMFLYAFIPLINYLTSSFWLTFLVIMFIFSITVWCDPALGMYLLFDIFTVVSWLYFRAETLYLIILAFWF